jgi:hypothetical protein
LPAPDETIGEGGATARPSSDIPGTKRGPGATTRKDARRSCSAARGRRSRGSSCAVPGRRRGGARRRPWRACSRRAAARWRRTRASSAGRIAIARGTRRYRSCTSLASVSVQTRDATGSTAHCGSAARRAAAASVAGVATGARLTPVSDETGAVGPTRSTRPRLASAFDEDGTLLLSTQNTLRRSHACRGSPGPSCDAGNNLTPRAQYCARSRN